MLRGRLLIISSPRSTTALKLGRLLNGSKQTSKKLCEVIMTPLHTSGNMKRRCRFLPHDAMLAQYMPSLCVCLCVSVCLSHSGIYVLVKLLWDECQVVKMKVKPVSDRK